MDTNPKSLTELDEVNWSNLTDAYGDASDLPDHLRGLSDDHWEERAEAYAALISKVWHQGDVYEATAPAAPFVADLMCGPAGPTAYFAGAVLALVAKSAFAPLVDAAVPDNAARRQCRKQLIALGSQLSECMTDHPEEDPRTMLASHLSRIASGEFEKAHENFEEAYARCETEAERLNGEDEESAPTSEFARWLDEHDELSRRAQVVALRRAREHALESPHLAASALERITADHLHHEKRLIEALVELGRGHRDSARQTALELGREWLAPPEAGGLNQSVSREMILSLLKHFTHTSARELHDQVRRADEPEYVIPDW